MDVLLDFSALSRCFLIDRVYTQNAPPTSPLTTVESTGVLPVELHVLPTPVPPSLNQVVSKLLSTPSKHFGGVRPTWDLDPNASGAYRTFLNDINVIAFVK